MAQMPISLGRDNHIGNVPIFGLSVSLTAKCDGRQPLCPSCRLKSPLIKVGVCRDCGKQTQSMSHGLCSDCARTRRVCCYFDCRQPI